MSTELAHTTPAVSGPPSPAEWQSIQEMARAIHASGLAPSALNSPEKVAVVALKGRELAVPPMQALSHIHVIEGKPTLSAELMVALVQRAGHKVRVVETSSDKAVVEGVRRDDPDYTPRVEFTWNDAVKAVNVEKRDNWKRHPAAMLRARAISALCRMAFADVLLGASYTPEELGADVDVADDGSVVTVTASQAQPQPEAQGAYDPDADGELHTAWEEACAVGHELDWRTVADFAAKNRDGCLKRLAELAAHPPEDPDAEATGTEQIAAQAEPAPFDPVTDEQMQQLLYVLSQLPEPENEQTRVLQETEVGELGELSAQQASQHVDRLTKRLAEKQAAEAAKESASA